jgi:predicted ATP-grasp superfamily ATP-dependent carboligase
MTDFDDKPYAVIVGLDNITGLQTARILNDRSVPVIGIAGNRDYWACRTRACERVLEARIDSAELIETLETLGPTLQSRAVLVPCTDLAVMNISANRARLSPWFHIRLPEHSTVERLTDKLEFVSFAIENELPIPQTFMLRSREAAEAAASSAVYPCVLKPALRSVDWDAEAGGKVLRVNSAAEFLSTYDRVAGLAKTLIAQEWVEGTDGDLFSCNCYYDRKAQPLASFIARKIRQWPPVAGISCSGEEVRNDEVLDVSLRLFTAARYQGLGYVEMKRDARTGRHYIIEPNIGRPTGRSAIAEGGGVELLMTMYCDAVGLPLPENRHQRYSGVKWIYLRQDLRSAWFYWRRGEITLKEYLESIRGPKVFAVFSWRDLGPFIADVAGSLFKKARSSGRAS